MWHSKNQLERKDNGGGVNGRVAVAIEKDKRSQHALKWAIDHLLAKGSTVVLVHVNVKGPSSQTPWSGTKSVVNGGSLACKDPDDQTKGIFLPYRIYCIKKDIQCKDVLIDDADVARALIEYTSLEAIEHLVLGSSMKTGLLRRFKVADIPGAVAKGAPDFCTVYVVAKEKIQSMRSASRPAPSTSPLAAKLNQANIKQDLLEPHMPPTNYVRERRSVDARRLQLQDETELSRSPFTRRNFKCKSYGKNPFPGTDISFVRSERTNTDPIFYSLHGSTDIETSNPGISLSSETDENNSFEPLQYRRQSVDISSLPETLSILTDREILSPSTSNAMDDMGAEMRRLKLELKKTMEMYSSACKEALTAQQRTIELERWKREEERRLEEAKLAEEAALAIAEKEMAKSKAAIEAAEAQKRIAELEAQKRVAAEMKALKESEEKRKAIDALMNTVVRYRKYSIEEIEAATEFFADSRKVGEGGYGPVYKCHLDHTPVAVKVLRPDAAQGRSQFQQEVEVLSCIRHPNMVLLLGACPEYGCLVYDYMANGSLEECLFRQGNAPSLPWQLRFKIAAEIGTCLLFLHQRKPEPLVHRDLKPANILLDSNYVAKISDVGLARLVPPSVNDNVTQYRMTSTAGTFCYIDPEYQQTGMLGVKSDIYSLGIMYLQILTARPPMGLTHLVEKAIEEGEFAQILDPTVPDWPVQEALSLASMALKCAELRRKDRPDLAKVVMPELNRLRALGERSNYLAALASLMTPCNHTQISVLQRDGASRPFYAERAQ